MGDLVGARAAYERALAIDEMVFGPDHPDVALRVNNLGGVLQHLGDLRAARAAYERALAILRTTYGEDHPEVAKVHSNLGLVLYALGDTTSARAAFERALTADERAFGPDHPDVALRFNNLGLVLQSLGDLDGARTAFERALAIFTRVHDEHNAQAVRENLLKVQGKYGSESTTLRVSQQIPIGDVTWSFGITIGRSPSGFRHGIGIRELDELFLPVINVVTATKSRKKGNPLRIIDLLKTELAKGPARNDNAVAAAIDQLVTVVPDSRDALIEIFETPVVAANIGPVTKFVIAKIRQI